MSTKLHTLYRVEYRTPANIWQQFIITTDALIADEQAIQLCEFRNRPTRIIELKQTVIKEHENDSSRYISSNKRADEI
jgi:hypothetical protein